MFRYGMTAGLKGLIVYKQKILNSSVIKHTIFVIFLALSAKVLADQPPAMPVIVVHPESRDLIEYDEFTGRFQAFQNVELKARVSGYLEKIHFKDGQQVKAGDLLFSIDPRPYQAMLDEAKADLLSAESEQELARQEVARAEGLVKIKAVSQEQLDIRRSALNVASAQVQAAKASIQTASLQLGYTEIKAPIDGHISYRAVDIGNLIQADGEQVLTNIVSDSPLYFVFNVSETDYLNYQRRAIEKRLGNIDETELAIGIRLLDETDFVHHGVLDFIDNQLDKATSTIRLRALINDNAEGLLVPGIFGRVRIPATEKKPTLLIPDQAVLSDMANKIVLTVNEDNVVVPKPVVLGKLHEGKRVIKSGLELNDKIIIEGIFRAHPGSTVTPQFETETASQVSAQ
jgi:RND family efflux transporter MFP subunit